jgi:hypothetical protein
MEMKGKTRKGLPWLNCSAVLCHAPRRTLCTRHGGTRRINIGIQGVGFALV